MVKIRIFKKRKKEKIRLRPFKESALVHSYLDGLNGVEVGGSTQNPFGLEKTGGYANIDYCSNHGQKWQTSVFEPAKVNIVSLGDSLPFKDETLDYVISSHAIEHFFDPIKTINEWLRVVKPGGYVLLIVPHKERTFDRYRTITNEEEIIKRHTGELSIDNYAILKNDVKLKLQLEHKEEKSSPKNLIIYSEDKTFNEDYNQILEDPHHHWSVWDTQSFLKLCETQNWNVVEHQDVDDKVGNGFTVVIKK